MSSFDRSVTLGTTVESDSMLAADVISVVYSAYLSAVRVNCLSVE